MIEVKSIQSVDYPAWDQYAVEQQGGGSYLATAWKEAMEKAYGLQTFYLAAFDKGDLLGILPLAWVKSPWGQGKLVSLPYCDYGGLLADNDHVGSMLLDRAMALAGEKRSGLEIRCPAANSIMEQRQEFAQVTDKCRMVLDLPGSAGQLWNTFKSKLRSQINRPGKAGLGCRLGKSELLADFYQVFSRNMRDLGSPIHSKKWIGDIVASYGDRAIVAVVYQESCPVAAGLILCHGSRVTIPWASSLREFNRLSPNMLLYWSFLEYAAERGFASFDFGRSTPEEGTFQFKKQWGARPHSLYWYRWGNAPADNNKGEAQGYRLMAEKLWQYLPLQVANLCGPWLRKYIDR